MEIFDHFLSNLKNESIDNTKIDLQLILVKDNIRIIQNDFFSIFKLVFKIQFKKEFIEDNESIEFVKLLINYFFQNDNFFNSPCLKKQINFPSFCKGLIIVGNPGIGKSDILKVFEIIFKKYCKINKNFYFIISDSNNIVKEFESTVNQFSRNDFYTRYSNAFRCLDDVKCEPYGSNFGKTNVIKEILHARHKSDKKTIITCNYDNEYPDDFIKAIDEFGTKYGERIYDRLFEMFNFIEIKGQSKRI